VPAGEYVAHAWRPGGQILNLSVTVGAGTVVDVRWP
jgi:hypothetical protein